MFLKPGISFEWSTYHWHRNGTQHGPQSNPRIFTLRLVRLGGSLPSFFGYRVWVYVRGGYAFHFGFFVDRRAVCTSD